MRPLWDFSGLKRVRKCRRVRTNEAGDVPVFDNAGVAHYSGLATCGSVWACPLCSAKIRAERSEEISRGVANWDRQGGTVLLLAATMPHDMGDRLRDTFSTIAAAWKAFQQSKGWRAIRCELAFAGKIRTFEVTHGANGWHPHMHAVLLFENDLDEWQFARLDQLLRKEWGRFITKRGYRPPDERYGIDLQRCHSAQDAAEYLAKTQDGKDPGNELTRSDLKTGRNGGRTPFQILADFRATGDEADLALWREYEDATFGRKAIQWDPGLRQRLAVEDERSDEEIAEEEIGGDVVAIIPGDVWVEITRREGLPAAVLDTAERCGLDGINDLLHRHGLYAHPPPEFTDFR